MMKRLDFIKRRIKKRIKASEFYKTEIPEDISAFIKSFKSTIYFFFIFFIIYKNFNFPTSKMFPFFLSLSCSLFFYQISNTILNAWKTLHKLHTIIEEENYEITHHRAKERKELEEMYKAKGFSSKQLQEVVDVLMADDNRLLQVMMEEEMGLVLRRYEHPIKQGFFAGLGTLISAVCLLLLLNFPSEFFILGAILIILSSLYPLKEKKDLSYVILWNLSILTSVSFITFFFIKFILKLYENL